LAESRLTRQKWTLNVVEGSFPTPTRVSAVPRVWVVDDFATSGVCAHVISVGADVEAGTSSQEISTRHDTTGFSFELPIAGDPILEQIDRHVQDIMGVADTAGGTFRFRRYRSGESHPPHTDVWEIQGAWLVGTAMLCIQAPVAGGSTDFLSSVPPLSVPPRAGRLTIWANHRPDGPPDEASLHNGAPVLEGEKITITRFVYRPLEGDSFVAHGLPEVRV